MGALRAQDGAVQSLLHGQSELGELTGVAEGFLPGRHEGDFGRGEQDPGAGEEDHRSYVPDGDDVQE